MNGAAEIARKLHRPGPVETKLVTKRLALGFRHGLADNLAQRIAESGAHGEGDDQDRQHDEQGLGEAARDEGERRGNRASGAHARAMGVGQRCDGND